jgi:hypothetical protein
LEIRNGILMKILATLILLLWGSVHLSAQSHRPDDFYVKKNGDTIYGRYLYGTRMGKYDTFRNSDRDKVQLKPDSIQSYSSYRENADLSRDDPNYYYIWNWINIKNGFYQIYYRDSNVVSIVSQTIPGSGFTTGPTWDSDLFYIYKNGILSESFMPLKFYPVAKTFLADCPSILELLEHVPNEINKEKTHKATLKDAGFIISKYNECVKGK